MARISYFVISFLVLLCVITPVNAGAIIDQNPTFVASGSVIPNGSAAASNGSYIQFNAISAAWTNTIISCTNTVNSSATPYSTSGGIDGYQFSIPSSLMQKPNFIPTSFCSDKTRLVGWGLFGGTYYQLVQWNFNYSISSPPDVNFTATPTSGKAPLLVNFTDTTTCSPACEYSLWDFGNGVVQNTTSKTTQVTYLNAGSYNISLRTSNTVGSGSLTRPDYITVTNVPFANFDWDFENKTLFGCNRIVVWDTSQNTPLTSFFAMGDYNTCEDPNSTSCGVMKGSILGKPSGDAWIESFNYTYPGDYTINHNVSNSWGVGYTSKVITIPPNCQITPTPTPTPTPNTTPIQTYPTPSFSGSNLTSFNLTNMTAIPSGLSYPRAYNLSYIRSWIIQNNPYSVYLLNFTDDFLESLNNYLMFPVFMILSPITQIVQIITFVLSAFNSMLNGYATLLALPYQVIVKIINAIHWKVKAAITFGLIVDLIIQVWNIKKGDWR